MNDAETDLIPLRDPDPQHADPTDRDQPQPQDQNGDATRRPTSATRAEPNDDTDTDTDLVIASGLDHGSGHRRVFAGLGFRLPAGTLGVVQGGGGSGRSTLLLALIGRATSLQGSLQVAGHDALRGSRRLRSITTAARIGSIVDTEPKHSIIDAVRDRAAVEGLRPTRARRTFSELAQVVGLDASADDLVEDLDSYQRCTLALALAALRPSTLMVLDDADHGLNVADQDRLFATITRLMSHTSSTVVASTAEPDTIPYDAVTISLPHPGAAEHSSR